MKYLLAELRTGSHPSILDSPSCLAKILQLPNSPINCSRYPSLISSPQFCNEIPHHHGPIRQSPLLLHRVRLEHVPHITARSPLLVRFILDSPHMAFSLTLMPTTLIQTHPFRPYILAPHHPLENPAGRLRLVERHLMPSVKHPRHDWHLRKRVAGLFGSQGILHLFTTARSADRPADLDTGTPAWLVADMSAIVRASSGEHSAGV